MNQWNAFLLILKGRDLTAVPLIERPKLLATLKVKSERIRIADYFEASSADVVSAAKAQNLEGVIGKLRNSHYEAGQRTGAWIKHRLNAGQEFVIGGYTSGPHGIDAIIVGYYRGKDLIYVARTRNGFVPAVEAKRVCETQTADCSRVPIRKPARDRKVRWGEALSAEKLKQCVWVRPEVVVQVEFLEWTDADHLRHKFAGLRENKDAQRVAKEEPK